MNAIDLTTVDYVKDWLAIPSDKKASDEIIGRVITAASQAFVNLCGFADESGAAFEESPFVTPVDYDETYDGNGSLQLFTRVRPIQLVYSLELNGRTVDPSPQTNITGYVISRDKKSIRLRGRSSRDAWMRDTGFGFTEGSANVRLQYQAGYEQTPEDVVQAATEMAGFTIRSRQWIGQSSQALPQGGGTVSYRDIVIPKSAKLIISFYSRTAIV
jgi:hypothetical protein